MLLAFPATLICAGMFLPCQYDGTFLGEMKYKFKRLKETEGKRIVVVGGSSVAFSLKSDLIEDYVDGYAAVNFGMYADMGVSVMLDWAKAEIHEGDIFIISPEQSEQTLSCHFSAEDFWQCADGEMSLFNYLSSERKQSAIAAFPAFAGRKMYYAASGSPNPDGIYARTSFNEYGDISYAERTCNIMSQRYNPNQPVSFGADMISEEFIAELNDFSDYAVARGAQVYYRFCPINELALYPEDAEEGLDDYFDYLSGKLNFPIIGNPHSAIMGAEWFYDTNFHLNDSGATLFTRGIIEDLKLLKGDSSPTDIPTPEAPQFPESSVTEGDNSDADKFNYAPEGGGLIITGLNDAGRAATKLTIPASKDGKPVTGIAPDVFAENTAVREIVIQGNIGLLYDGMFDGCTSLEKLILTGAPSDYTVGDGLRTGAEFLIYVNKSQENNFKLDYGWQKYALYIRPLEDS